LRKGCKSGRHIELPSVDIGTEIGKPNGYNQEEEGEDRIWESESKIGTQAGLWISLKENLSRCVGNEGLQQIIELGECGSSWERESIKKRCRKIYRKKERSTKSGWGLLGMIFSS